MRKIGIYGGTFDPVHHAHLILAREALETLDLEKMIFVPAARSPHKMETPPTPAPLRLEMLRVAIAQEAGFVIDECELQRDPPSFAFDTVKEIRARERDAEFFYFIGEDNVPRLSTWHRFAELEKLVQFVVLDRTGRHAQPGYPIIQRHIDISSTDIRKRVARGRSIRYLVPAAVADIIARESLYREPDKSPPIT